MLNFLIGVAIGGILGILLMCCIILNELYGKESAKKEHIKDLIKANLVEEIKD